MFKNKQSFIYALLVLVLAFSATACNPDEALEQTTPSAVVETRMTPALQRVLNADGENDTTQSDTTYQGEECFTFNYPLSIQTGENQTMTATSEEELMSIIEQIADTGVEADFVYPFTVTTDGDLVTINNFDDFASVLEACFEGDWDDGEWDGEHGDCPDDIGGFLACYDIVFPITLSLPDSVTTQTVNSPEEFIEFLEGLGEEAAGVDFVYPIDLVAVISGEELTVNNSDELNAAIEACGFFPGDDDGDWDGEYEVDSSYLDIFFGCLEIDFPVSFDLGDSIGVVAINSPEDFFAMVSGLDPATAEAIEIVYPITLTVSETGEELTINNEAELTAAAELCGGDFPDGEEDGSSLCFDFNFPIQVTDSLGTNVITLNGPEDLALLGNEEGAAFDFVYPFSVTLAVDGSNYTVNSEDDFTALLQQCN